MQYSMFNRRRILLITNIQEIVNLIDFYCSKDKLCYQASISFINHQAKPKKVIVKFRLTCKELSQSPKREALRSLFQHHDLFEAVQAAAQPQQAKDVGGLPGSVTETAQLEIQAEVEQLAQWTLLSPRTMMPEPPNLSYFYKPLSCVPALVEKLKCNAAMHQ